MVKPMDKSNCIHRLPSWARRGDNCHTDHLNGRLIRCQDCNKALGRVCPTCSRVY